MSTNVAIVDDQNPLIHYTGTWQTAGAAQEFQSTTSWSALQGSTASFAFNGSSVTVFGTVAAKNPPQSSLTFIVDNSISETYTPPSNMTSDIHHEILWASPPLSDGSHQLVITQTAAQASGVIFLDYIMWNTTSHAVPAYFIDDRDSRVQYTPPWQQFGSDPDFMHTSQGTANVGDSLSLQFDGTAISFFGGINNGSAGQVLNASMSIDSGPPVFFVPGQQPAAVTTNNLIFHSGDLKAGTHKLTVTAENIHTVWADYFLVTPNPASSASATSSSPSSGSSSTPTPAPKSSHTAAIAGSVVAVVALIVIAVAAYFFLRRRRQRRYSGELPMSQGLDPTPFPRPDMAPTLTGATAGSSNAAGGAWSFAGGNGEPTWVADDGAWAAGAAAGSSNAVAGPSMSQRSGPGASSGALVEAHGPPFPESQQARPFTPPNAGYGYTAVAATATDADARSHAPGSSAGGPGGSPYGGLAPSDTRSHAPGSSAGGSRGGSSAAGNTTGGSSSLGVAPLAPAPTTIPSSKLARYQAPPVRADGDDAPPLYEA